ncbi:hypothetical protein LCGC14_2415440, partial [marine sediment metagenome]
ITKTRKKYTRKLKREKKPFDPFHLIDDKTFIQNIAVMGSYTYRLCHTKNKSGEKS